VEILKNEKGDYDKKTGSILWETAINSGDLESFNFEYEIKYPKDKIVNYRN